VWLGNTIGEWEREKITDINDRYTQMEGELEISLKC
jgi:hypothetical protein